MIEHENLDPAGPRDPKARFRAGAEICGVIRQGDPLDRNIIGLCGAVVRMYTEITDQHPRARVDADIVGHHIRAEVGAEL
ncbi:MAG: hypothetical protein KKC79_05495 [Gammaproteobacteria bacterium]|nr:hypothetical protein [Gammaproteobacteria bacterium]MBU1442390.1 hypothetical protein [Gammaproteobacteria bacterium]MBU2288629.1 hypothetical protein [Gammaproteobacteria bacterium]MBU2408088.1 hypothetical protein [Gammaproteobacteria bacterium]